MKSLRTSALGTPFADLRVSSPEEIRSSQGKGCNEGSLCRAFGSHPDAFLGAHLQPDGRGALLGRAFAGGGRPAGAGSVSGSLSPPPPPRITERMGWI